MFWYLVLLTAACCAPLTGDPHDVNNEVSGNDVIGCNNVNDVKSGGVKCASLIQFNKKEKKKELKEANVQKMIRLLSDIVWQTEQNQPDEDFHNVYEDLLDIVKDYERFFVDGKLSASHPVDMPSNGAGEDSDVMFEDRTNGEQSVEMSNLLLDYIDENFDYILQDLEILDDGPYGPSGDHGLLTVLGQEREVKDETGEGEDGSGERRLRVSGNNGMYTFNESQTRMTNKIEW